MRGVPTWNRFGTPKPLGVLISTATDAESSKVEKGVRCVATHPTNTAPVLSLRKPVMATPVELHAPAEVFQKEHTTADRSSTRVSSIQKPTGGSSAAEVLAPLSTAKSSVAPVSASLTMNSATEELGTPPLTVVATSKGDTPQLTTAASRTLPDMTCRATESCDDDDDATSDTVALASLVDQRATTSCPHSHNRAPS
jgi:hypothetical protein